MEEELERLRKKNNELETEAEKGKEREASLKQELSKAIAQLQLTEEAEERLSAEIGDLEADSLQRALSYEVRIQELTEQLALAHREMKASQIKT